MYLLVDFCCTLLAHIPIYIAPSFVKLFLLLYSGFGEVEGRERNRKKKFNQNLSTSILQLCSWHSEGPVLKPQHLECKMQFHSTWAPWEPCASARAGEGPRQRTRCSSRAITAVAASWRHRALDGRRIGLWRSGWLMIRAFACSAFF